MIRLKICGIQRTEDIEIINRYKPDFCGFIVDFPKSHRSKTEQEVKNLRTSLSDDVIPVGVFVNAPADLVIRMLNEDTISAAQLHGSEDDDYIRYIIESTGKPVIKAFQLKENGGQVLRQALNSPADWILLDQGQGSGQTFDWNIIAESGLEDELANRKWILAGGLNAANIRQAVQKLHPDAVDLSSSLETDGYKDEEKIKEITDIVMEMNTTDD